MFLFVGVVVQTAIKGGGFFVTHVKSGFSHYLKAKSDYEDLRKVEVCPIGRTIVDNSKLIPANHRIRGFHGGLASEWLLQAEKVNVVARKPLFVGSKMVAADYSYVYKERGVLLQIAASVDSQIDFEKGYGAHFQFSLGTVVSVASVHELSSEYIKHRKHEEAVKEKIPGLFESAVTVLTKTKDSLAIYLKS